MLIKLLALVLWLGLGFVAYLIVGPSLWTKVALALGIFATIGFFHPEVSRLLAWIRRPGESRNVRRGL